METATKQTIRESEMLKAHEAVDAGEALPRTCALQIRFFEWFAGCPELQVIHIRVVELRNRPWIRLEP